MKNSRPKDGWQLAVMAIGALAGAVMLLALAPPATSRPALCEQAALRAASESGVPADVLLAIALVETGRSIDGRMRPWPWAANAEGRGYWFTSHDDAAAFARQRLEQGRPSFDLGCFQINWRWHGHQFDRPEALLDPLTAARYAAHFLSALHAELGDWEAAAGAYHSRTPYLAKRYRARFRQHRAGLARTGLPTLASPGGRRPVPNRPEPDLAATPRAGGDMETGARRRGQVALALIRPGPPARDPASLLPATPPQNPADLLSGPGSRPVIGKAGAPMRQPVVDVPPAGAAPAALPVSLATPLAAFIPALAGELP